MSVDLCGVGVFACSFSTKNCKGAVKAASPWPYCGINNNSETLPALAGSGEDIVTARRIRLIGVMLFVVLLSAAWTRTRGVPGMASSILVKWHQDENFYYLESTGMPTHKMMVGITAWQQQVPLPQDFTGDNAFKIPRHPVFSDKPVSAKTALFSGAIAVAVNGIPIFNPIKNDGHTDTYTAGELDLFGGHCGRADDYHYHIAPLFLVDVVGKEIHRLCSRWLSAVWPHRAGWVGAGGAR